MDLRPCADTHTTGTPHPSDLEVEREEAPAPRAARSRASRPHAHAQVFGQYTPAEILPVNARLGGAYVNFSEDVVGALGQLRLSFYPNVDFGFQGGLARLDLRTTTKTSLRLGADVRFGVAKATAGRPVDVAVGGGLGVETSDNYSVFRIGPVGRGQPRLPLLGQLLGRALRGRDALLHELGRWTPRARPTSPCPCGWERNCAPSPACASRPSSSCASATISTTARPFRPGSTSRSEPATRAGPGATPLHGCFVGRNCQYHSALRRTCLTPKWALSGPAGGASLPAPEWSPSSAAARGNRQSLPNQSNE